jgi:hypothetical protein
VEIMLGKTITVFNSIAISLDSLIDNSATFTVMESH